MDLFKPRKMNLIDRYDCNLMELDSIATKYCNLEQMVEYYEDFEKKMRTLDKEYILITGVRIPQCNHYHHKSEEYRNLIQDRINFIDTLSILKAPTTEDESDVLILVATQEYYKLYTNEYLGISLKRTFSQQLYAIENKMLGSQKLKLLVQYENKLIEIESLGEKDLDLQEMEEFCGNFETMMNNLDSEETYILMGEIRDSFKCRYLVNLQKYQTFIENIYHFYHQLEFISAPVLEDDPQFSKLLFQVEQDLNKLKANAYLGKSLNLKLSTEYKTRIEH